MKKIGTLLMCLSLGLFTVGCQPSEETTKPVGNGDAAAPADADKAGEEGAVVEPETTPPAGETTE